MTILDINAKVLEQLGAGDDVFASEALKKKAVAVATALGVGKVNPSATTTEEHVATALRPVNAPAEEFLAVLLPVIEYGGPRTLDAIPRALVHIAKETSLLGRDSGLQAAVGALVVGRLGWALTAYALHCERLDSLNAAWRALAPPRYEEEPPTPLLADLGLRHSDAFERDAGKAYADYHSWLAGRQLVVARYPLFVADFDDVFAEGDFLLALLAESVSRSGVYSHGFTRQTVTRFRGRLGDSAFREALARLFGVSFSELEKTLASAYGSVTTNPHRFDRPPAHLFPEKGAS